eukprot:COSAG05_NODE_1179_length_5607_cov_13.007711_1_plen_45_part_10
MVQNFMSTGDFVHGLEHSFNAWMAAKYPTVLETQESEETRSKKQR